MRADPPLSTASASKVRHEHLAQLTSTDPRYIAQTRKTSVPYSDGKFMQRRMGFSRNSMMVRLEQW